MYPIQAHVVEYWSPAVALLAKVIEPLGKFMGLCYKKLVTVVAVEAL